MVGVAVAVDGGEDERSVGQFQALNDVSLLLSDFSEMQAVVVHDVATVVDLGIVDGVGSVVVHGEAFAFQVLDASEGGGEQQGGAVVAHDAVDFFGHGLVERTQSRLNVSDGHMDFGSGHGTS